MPAKKSNPVSYATKKAKNVGTRARAATKPMTNKMLDGLQVFFNMLEGKNPMKKKPAAKKSVSRK